MINILKGQQLGTVTMILSRKKTVLLRIALSDTLFCIQLILKTIAGKGLSTSTKILKYGYLPGNNPTKKPGCFSGLGFYEQWL
jgi:hypothetical protein